MSRSPGSHAVYTQELYLQAILPGGDSDGLCDTHGTTLRLSNFSRNLIKSGSFHSVPISVLIADGNRQFDVTTYGVITDDLVLESRIHGDHFEGFSFCFK